MSMLVRQRIQTTDRVQQNSSCKMLGYQVPTISQNLACEALRFYICTIRDVEVLSRWSMEI